MPYTLIASIGTGLRKESGYRKTVYRFPDGSEFETALFLQAILKSNNFKEIDSVLLSGTRTSDWGALLSSSDTPNDELFYKIIQESENKGITDSSLSLLQTFLTETWRIPFQLNCHTHKIDNDTISEIFASYSKLVSSVPSDKPVLLDITHGFRSMPLLMYQAIQYCTANGQRRQIELIYGEYIDTEKISYVRDLSSYWKISEYTAALHLFRERFDGFSLAELIKEEWSDGANWLSKFSGMVQANFSLQLHEHIRILKNYLKSFNNQEASTMVLEVYAELEKLSTLYSNKTSKTILKFAEVLSNKKMFTQAVIALQIAVEAATMEQINREDEIGNYDFWHEQGKKELKRLCKKDNNLYKKLKNLEYIRNQIAHGGAKNPDTGGFPAQQNLKNQFESAFAAVQKVCNGNV